MFRSTGLPSINSFAVSTPNLPIRSGFCWTVAASLPALTAATASGVASKPTMATFLRPASSIAFSAPRAISSFCAKTPWMSLLPCKMFSITVSPWARSKFAGCLATTFTPGLPSIAASKPSPRSRAALEPGMPTSSTRLPLPPSFFSRNSPAIRPPATLSEAMCELTSAPFTARSSEITLIPAAVASFTTFATASESAGFNRMTGAFFWIRSSTPAICLAASFCASTAIRLIPTALASACAPSRSETKNGLSIVESARPTVAVTGAAAVAAAVPPGPPSGARLEQAIKKNRFATQIDMPRIMPNSSCLVSPQDSALGFAAPIQQHREQNHRALGDLLVERRYAHEVQAVVEHADQQRTHQGAEDPAAPAGEAGAAEHNRGDRIEFIAGTGGRLSGIEPRGENHAGERGHRAGDGIHEDLHPVGLHARELGRLGAPAGGIHVPAEHGSREQEPEYCEHCQHQHDGKRNQPGHIAAAQQRKEIAGETSDRAAV